MKNQDRVFIYWDTSNIFLEARRIAEERNGDTDARNRVCLHLEQMFRLAHAGREVGAAIAVGCVPPENRQFWKRLGNLGVEVELFDRGSIECGEEETPDHFLQLRMLQDTLDYSGDPGIAVLLSGDGAGYHHGVEFHSTLERMHRFGWRVEVLSWRHACKRGLREWVEKNGKFVALDDHYDEVTFPEVLRSKPKAAKLVTELADHFLKEMADYDSHKEDASDAQSGKYIVTVGGTKVGFVATNNERYVEKFRADRECQLAVQLISFEADEVRSVVFHCESTENSDPTFKSFVWKGRVELESPGLVGDAWSSIKDQTVRLARKYIDEGAGAL